MAYKIISQIIYGLSLSVNLSSYFKATKAIRYLGDHYTSIDGPISLFTIDNFPDTTSD
ncbi:MAG: hypothetical protein ACJ0IB_02975 [Verrucomicrobiales bacterium]